MLARTYDDIAPHYDKLMRRLDRWFLAALRARTLSHLPRSGLILEIGAGTGGNFNLYPLDTFAIGIVTEPSKGMLLEAVAKKPGPEFHLVQSCAEQLPFPENSFDAAFARWCFVHSVHPSRRSQSYAASSKPAA
jgi:ubiquinone/menaquinone biosynthesis C-methylase UbiE